MRKAVFALVSLLVLAAALPAVAALVSGAPGISEYQVTEWRDGDLVVYPLSYPFGADYGSPVAVQLVIINATPSHAVYVSLDNTTLTLNQTRCYSFLVSLDPGVHSFAVLTNYSVLYATLFRIVVWSWWFPPPGPTVSFTLAQLLDLRTQIAQTALIAGLAGGVLGAASKRYTKVTVYLLLAISGGVAGFGWMNFASLYALAIGAMLFMATYFFGGETCEYVMLTKIQGDKLENHIYQAANNYTIDGMTLRRRKIEVKDARPLKFSLPHMESVTLHFVKEILSDRHSIKATADRAFTQALIDGKLVEKLDAKLKDSELERNLLQRATKSYAMWIFREFEDIISTHKIDSSKGFGETEAALEELKKRIAKAPVESKVEDDKPKKSGRASES